MQAPGADCISAFVYRYLRKTMWAAAFVSDMFSISMCLDQVMVYPHLLATVRALACACTVY